MAVGSLIVLAWLTALVVKRVARPVAVNALAGWLREHGAPSRIDLQSFDAHGLSAHVMLGDPRDPDLTVERLDITYTLSGPWNGKALGVTPSSVRLVRPRLRVALVDGRLDFGRLDGLVAWARSLPPSKTALPDIEIVAGEVRLQSPAGAATLTGDGRLRRGRLELLQGRLAPVKGFSLGGMNVTSLGGGIRLVGRGRQLLASLDLGPSRLSIGGAATASAALESLRLEGALPYPDNRDKPDRILGPVRLDLSARGVRAQTRRARGGLSMVKADLTGALDAAASGQRFTGALVVEGEELSGASGDATLKAATTRIALTDLAFVNDIEDVSMRANGRLSGAGGTVGSPDGALTGLAANLSLTGGRLTHRHGRFDSAGLLSGGFHAHGAVSPACLRALVNALPLVEGERPYGRALAGAAASFDVAAPDMRLELSGDGGRLSLNAPLTIAAASGARLTLVGSATADATRITGAAGLRLASGRAPSLELAIGNAVATREGGRARFSGRSEVDTAAIQGGALMARGDLAIMGGALRLTLSDCAPIGAARLDLPVGPVRDLALRLCPGTAPLLRVARTGWHSSGRLEAAGATLPGLELAARLADLDFEAAGGGAKSTWAHVRLGHTELSDVASAQRFKPLGFTGRLDLDQGQWRGAFQAMFAGGRAAANLTLIDDMARGEGRLDLVAPDLTFAPGGLQPTDLSPLASPIRNVDAHTALSGWMAWDGHGDTTSGGRITAQASALTGPTGVVKDLAADIRLTSLFPPTSAPGQSLSVGTIEAITPLTDLQGRFQLEADGLRIERLDAAVAKGKVSLEPFSVPFAPGASISSALILSGVDLGDIIAATNIADTVKVEARVSGRVPFTAGPAGLVVVRGSLSADAPGRISISRKAFESGSPASAAPNYAQDFAYQAMEDLAFDSLDATVASLPHERLGMIFHVKGRHDPPARRRALVRLADVLRGQMFARPLPLPSGTDIDMTLDTSLNFGELIAALEASWRDALSVRGAKRALPEAAGADPANTTGPETERQ